MTKEDKHTYRVAEKKVEVPGITTLRLMPVDMDRPGFESGQFITVYFPELSPSEGKAYSISSAPHEEGFFITVKDIGAFSHRLSMMEIGETLTASGPYGFFYTEEPDTPLVLLAGGIGIAPFRSMIHDILNKKSSRKVALYYSVPEHQNAIFMNLFSFFAKEYPNFTYTIHITKGEAAAPDCRTGRISVESILSLHGDDSATEYLMCGSIPFVRDMWKGLRGHGVAEEKLYTEAFFA